MINETYARPLPAEPAPQSPISESSTAESPVAESSFAEYTMAELPALPTGMKRPRAPAVAVACETCRRRKQRCDGARPRCTRCVEHGSTCHYEPSKPTKKDQAIETISASVHRMEPKIHEAHEASSHIPTILRGIEALLLQSQTATNMLDSGDDGPSTTTNLQPSKCPIPRDDQQQYVSAVHKMMRWDEVRRMLAGVGITPSPEVDFFKSNFPSLILEQQGRTEPLPMVSTLKLGTLNRTFVKDRSKVYFETFHLMHPILDEHGHANTTIPRAFIRSRLTDNAEATLVLLVLALADVGEAAFRNPGFVQQQGRQHGEPPGLHYFNEARRRMGFFVTDCTLEAVQIQILAGLYFDSCYRHLEFWRMTAMASLACHRLITSDPNRTRSRSQHDLIRRAYWHCCIIETGLHLELDLPLTALTSLKEQQWMTSMFSDNLDPNGSDFYERHFYSHIRLRDHATKIHRSLTAMNGLGRVYVSGCFSQKERDVNSSNLSCEIESRARNLSDWRSNLNAEMQWDELRWNESSKMADVPVSPFPELFHPTPSYPTPNEQVRPVCFPNDTRHIPQQLQQMPLLQQLQQMQQLPQEAVGPAAGVDDVLNALLKTRYYYLRCLLYRPYIFRVLHSDKAYPADKAGAREYLRACIMWPILMPPVCHSKAIIPSLYLWTQNILGILIVLYLSNNHPRLMLVRDEMTPSNKPDVFGPRSAETIRLCIEWIRSVAANDKTAEWCWVIVKQLFPYDIPDERMAEAQVL